MNLNVDLNLDILNFNLNLNLILNMKAMATPQHVSANHSQAGNGGFGAYESRTPGFIATPQALSERSMASDFNTSLNLKLKAESKPRQTNQNLNMKPQIRTCSLLLNSSSDLD
jgi:hypothetical protein